MLKLSNTLLSIIQNFDYILQITKQKCNKFCANRMQSEWKKRRSEIKRNKKNKREKEKGLTDQWLRDLFRLSVWLWRKRERCTCKCKKFLNSVSGEVLSGAFWVGLGIVWLIIWHFGLDNANNEFLGYFFNIGVGWLGLLLEAHLKFKLFI